MASLFTTRETCFVRRPRPPTLPLLPRVCGSHATNTHHRHTCVAPRRSRSPWRFRHRTPHSRHRRHHLRTPVSRQQPLHSRCFIFASRATRHTTARCTALTQPLIHLHPEYQSPPPPPGLPHPALLQQDSPSQTITSGAQRVPPSPLLATAPPLSAMPAHEAVSTGHAQWRPTPTLPSSTSILTSIGIHQHAHAFSRA